MNSFDWRRLRHTPLRVLRRMWDQKWRMKHAKDSFCAAIYCYVTSSYHHTSSLIIHTDRTEFGWHWILNALFTKIRTQGQGCLWSENRVKVLGLRGSIEQFPAFAVPIRLSDRSTGSLPEDFTHDRLLRYRTSLLRTNKLVIKTIFLSSPLMFLHARVVVWAVVVRNNGLDWLLCFLIHSIDPLLLLQWSYAQNFPKTDSTHPPKPAFLTSRTNPTWQWDRLRWRPGVVSPWTSRGTIRIENETNKFCFLPWCTVLQGTADRAM